MNHPFSVKAPVVVSWWERAACSGHPTSDWYPGTEPGEAAAAARALRICHGCPVRLDCLRYALDAPELHGIWGGVEERRRHKLRSA